MGRTTSEKSYKARLLYGSESALNNTNAKRRATRPRFRAALLNLNLVEVKETEAISFGATSTDVFLTSIADPWIEH